MQKQYLLNLVGAAALLALCACGTADKHDSKHVAQQEMSDEDNDRQAAATEAPGADVVATAEVPAQDEAPVQVAQADEQPAVEQQAAAEQMAEQKA